MLRAERASRRITHPNASYTGDGKLLCNLCDTLVKSEAAWQGHLHSTGHTLRLSRAREAAAARGVETSSKKRKASTLESPEATADDRKRVKPAEVAGERTQQEGVKILEGQGGILEDTAPLEERLEAIQALPATNGGTQSASQVAQPESVNESELAAFERDLADLEASGAPATALNAGATISAAPMTAEDIAAQAREEQSAQRGKRDAEIEAEKEDAARSLADEFEEMEGLEERVRKLRERREELRKFSGKAVSAPVTERAIPNGHATEDEDDDDEEEDELDEWGFGGN